MAASTKLKWRRAINQLKYLYEEFDLITQICKESGSEFEVYYRKYCAKNGVDIDGLNRQHKERLDSLYKNIRKPEAAVPPELPDDLEVQEVLPGSLILSPSREPEIHDPEYSVEDREMHEIFSKLFKKIAVTLHPDKVSSMDISPFLAKEMIDTFKSARTAFDERRYFDLVEIAERYRIPPPKNYALQHKWFQGESDRVKDVISRQKNTYNYLFSECSLESDKDELIRDFLRRLFGI